jgi:hypothetical protein
LDYIKTDMLSNYLLTIQKTTKNLKITNLAAKNRAGDIQNIKQELLLEPGKDVGGGNCSLY